MVAQNAKKKKKVIEIKAIEGTKTKLKEVLKEINLSLTEDQISKIAHKVAYKKPSIKDVQKYLLVNQLNLPFDEVLINRLYKIRNNLWHGVDYDESNSEELDKGTLELYDLLDRIILKLFGFEGASKV